MFKFALNDYVRFKFNDEFGQVVGACAYTEAKPQYLVQHKAMSGEDLLTWVPEDSICLLLDDQND